VAFIAIFNKDRKMEIGQAIRAEKAFPGRPVLGEHSLAGGGTLPGPILSFEPPRLGLLCAIMHAFDPPCYELNKVRLTSYEFLLFAIIYNPRGALARALMDWGTG